MKIKIHYLFLVVFLLMPVSSFASFTYVQDAGSASSGSTVTLTGVGAGHMLIVTTISYMATVTALSGNSNTYSTDASCTGAQNTNLATYTNIFWVLSANSGNTTITATTGASFFYMNAREYSYTGMSPAFDSCSFANDAGMLFGYFSSSSSITAAAAHELLVSNLVVYQGNPPAAPSGFAHLTQSSISDLDNNADVVDSASGATSIDWITFGIGSNWQVSNIAMKDTASAADNLAAKRLLQGIGR